MCNLQCDTDSASVGPGGQAPEAGRATGRTVTSSCRSSVTSSASGEFELGDVESVNEKTDSVADQRKELN